MQGTTASQTTSQSQSNPCSLACTAAADLLEATLPQISPVPKPLLLALVADLVSHAVASPAAAPVTPAQPAAAPQKGPEMLAQLFSCCKVRQSPSQMLGTSHCASQGILCHSTSAVGSVHALPGLVPLLTSRHPFCEALKALSDELLLPAEQVSEPHAAGHAGLALHCQAHGRPDHGPEQADPQPHAQGMSGHAFHRAKLFHFWGGIMCVMRDSHSRQLCAF